MSVMTRIAALAFLCAFLGAGALAQQQPPKAAPSAVRRPQPAPA